MSDVDMLNFVIQEMGKAFPTLKETLLYERDMYMSSTLLRVAREHNSVVVVVGKGQLQGIKKQPVEASDHYAIGLKIMNQLVSKINQELTLSLSLKCMSFNFVGTSLDESSKIFGIIQLHFDFPTIYIMFSGGIGVLSIAKQAVSRMTAKDGAAAVREGVVEELAEGHGDIGTKELMHMSEEETKEYVARSCQPPILDCQVSSVTPGLPPATNLPLSGTELSPSAYIQVTTNDDSPILI
ncbi:hypothetical protein GIB67_010176, partial [Kingdonia uniflora]